MQIHNWAGFDGFGSFVQRAFDRLEGYVWNERHIPDLWPKGLGMGWIVWCITFRGKESITIFARRSSHRFVRVFFFSVPGSRTLDWVGPLHREVDRVKARRDVDWLGLHQESCMLYSRDPFLKSVLRTPYSVSHPASPLELEAS